MNAVCNNRSVKIALPNSGEIKARNSAKDGSKRKHRVILALFSAFRFHKNDVNKLDGVYRWAIVSQ